MTTRELAALDARRAIALLPVGAIEQHGPHLPDAVDACIAQRIVARAPETSMMLHLRPDLVQMEHAGDFVPLAREMADEGFRLLSPTGPGKLALQAQDLHPSGACCDATNADADRGRALDDHPAGVLVKLSSSTASRPTGFVPARRSGAGGDGAQLRSATGGPCRPA